MNDVKSFTTSKTIWGAVIVLIPVAANLLGVNISGDDIAALGGHLDAIITAGGAVLAIYGRIKATSALKL